MNAAAGLAHDLRLAARSLAKTPGFALLAAGTLALGIGSNAAMFGVVSGMLLRPLPYPESGELVRIYTEFPTLSLKKFWMSPPEFFEVERDLPAFESVAAYTEGGVNVGGDDGPLRARAVQFTEGMLRTLGVTPAAGRGFTKDEDVTNGPRVVMVSDALWRRAFGARGDIVGAKILVQGAAHEVVGVLPPDFVFPLGASSSPDVVLPLGLSRTAEALERRGSHYLHVLGRLRDGATLEAAEAEKNRQIPLWAEAIKKNHVFGEKHLLLYVPAHEDAVGGARTAVWTLFAAVGFVLLIACVNVANLLLARGEAKRRETAIRVALGAARATLARRAFAEGLVLALAGAAVGAAGGWAALKGLMAAFPEALPRAAEIGIDGRVLVFATLLAIATAGAFSVAPLATLRDLDLGRDLQSGGTRTAGGLRGRRTRRALVAVQIALTVMLLVGAGLMIRTFRELQRADAGFDAAGVLTFELELPGASYRDNASRAAFWTRLEERLRALPGVTAAATMSDPPPVRTLLANDTDIDGYTAPPEGPFENVDYYQVSGRELLDVLKVRVEEGRPFDASDEGPDSPFVCLINRSLAKRFWGEKSALGGRLRPGDDGSPWATIVGIVPDVRNGGLDRPAGTEVFFLESQAARLGFASTQTTVALRTSSDPRSLVKASREALREIDPTLPMARVRTLEEIVDGSLERTRLIARLMTAFSAIAVALAAVGIYGVTAYTVARRTREIGVRVALGARPLDVRLMILGGGLVLCAVGLAAGFAGSIALTRLTASLLHGVRPEDPATYGMVALVVAALSAGACWIPAWRASRIDPAQALRWE